MKIMSAKQKGSASTLIKNECANYIGGMCIPLDTPCPQCHSYSLLCKYFAECVLPLDKVLHAEVMGHDGIKRCAVCNRPFRATSNRAKYCSECAARERKKAKAARMREYRAK